MTKQGKAVSVRPEQHTITALSKTQFRDVKEVTRRHSMYLINQSHCEKAQLRVPSILFIKNIHYVLEWFDPYNSDIDNAVY